MGRAADLDTSTSASLFRSPHHSPGSDSPLSKLQSNSKPMHFGARQVLFREGDHAEGVFILLGGIVRLSWYLPSGRRMVGAFVFTGGIIGLSFDDVYPFDAEAVGPAIVCRFNRAKL